MFTILLMGQAAWAQNTLSSIQINPNGSSYQIVLNTDEIVPVKKVIESSDKIYFELQGVTPLKTLSTIYNNVPNIDNVIVQPSSKNSVKIFVEGKNVAKAKLEFQALSTLKQNFMQKNETKKVELDRPLNTYSPIFEEDEIQSEVTPFVAANALSNIEQGVKNVFGSKLPLHILGFALVIIFGVRALRKKDKFDDEIRIGLTHSINNSNVFDNQAKTQAEKSERNEVRHPKKANGQIANYNYGINNYKNAQKSPYTSQIAPTYVSNSTTQSAATFERVTVPTSKSEIKSHTHGAITQQATQAKTTLQTAPEATKKSQGIDSIKFIESMSQIYEKNGRSDLAAGLRNNLRKAQNRQQFL